MRPSFLNIAFRTIPIVLTGVVMLLLSWRKWSDLIVDYGREAYVPWQLAKGGLLYKDIASFYGPLSSYVNSVLFRVFDTSIIAPQLFNVLLVAILTYFIYRLFKREDDGLAATVISCAFLILFAFGKHFNLGSYNYVAPYSHELVHGVFLAFAAIYGLKLYVTEKKLVWVFLTGLSTGLVLVTKMEIALALVMAIFPGFAAAIWKERPERGRILKLVGFLAAGIIIPVFFFIAFFSLYMGVGWAVKSVFSSWTVVAGTGISSSQFYKQVTGIDNLAVNIKGMFSMTGWFLLVLIPLVLDYLLRRNAIARRYGGLLSFVAVAGLMYWFAERIPWDLLFWPLPLFAAAIVLFFGWKLLAASGDGLGRGVPLFTLSVFSAALLIKIVFVTRIYGYGFVLAMPATLFVCYMLLSHIPAALNRRWGSSGIFRYSVLAALLVMLSFYFVKAYKLYERMDYAIGSGGDMIVASGFSGGKGVDILLEQINRVMAPGETFVMLPEGTLINYLSRRDNPTRYVSFLPSDMTIFGEDAILEELEAARPDYVVLISRDTIEYGAHYLGQGYGDSIFSFITNRYSDIVRIGDMGFLENSTGMSQPLGIVIMKRNEGS